VKLIDTVPVTVAVDIGEVLKVNEAEGVSAQTFVGNVERVPVKEDDREAVLLRVGAAFVGVLVALYERVEALDGDGWLDGVGDLVLVVDSGMVESGVLEVVLD